MMPAPFRKILIANRGEIACRIIRTACRLGISTVAVYSDPDRNALHTVMADEAYRLGPAPPEESYLRIETLIDTARRSGAEAIHPGYGFLAEDPRLAEACAAAGVVFIGPSAEAIRAMGRKSEARRLMAEAGVPLVPGFHQSGQSPKRLRQAAAELGYPVMIKASAGGGGKGMRLAASEEEFDRALESCRREALAAFGDGSLLLEKYLPRARHIEIQIFADRYGSLVHLFERDCSLQRRYQKVVEEAPAPGLSGELRGKMGETALAAARAVDYVGAGTVEFLLTDDGAYYFNEMNTRLQVEHPVTEMITGIDLVEWQLRVAAGDPLPCRQEDLVLHGHAVEARLYAEDPVRDFLPSAGRLEHLHLPSDEPGVRIDTGFSQGDTVSPHYDPLLAKVIAWGADREEARARLQRVLGKSLIAGMTTNLDFLAAIFAHPEHAASAIDTGFIPRNRDVLLAASPANPEARILAALFLLLRQGVEAREKSLSSGDPGSPWNRIDGWRLNGIAVREFVLREAGEEITVTLHRAPEGWTAVHPEGSQNVRGELSESGVLTAEIAGRLITIQTALAGGELTLLIGGRRCRFGVDDRPEITGRKRERHGSLTAPMPGRILAVLVEPGARVRQGEALLVLEAMKMEHTVIAPARGIVQEVFFRGGDQVEEGARLLSLEIDEVDGDEISEAGEAG
ncbi:acetyl/propionyl/methylcrotonyl-CoA carboxylase subunit alpha [Desulfuromonas sp. TF]|uniref:acetyl/propionyl/methylcrotonyl-CoA carboxylase subunit alpha n=1 Tax=Desulfuromonas sp. TF TaxID=1232410 RepID=UPI0026F400E6|nr:acetyl/propionyl/methylcrotonyl-CoA carboxylase subunit alpha [Desulfuromonas sp. TF]